MSVNGVLREQRSYDAAHQVVGWQYDAAGNLLADSTHSYGYDALGRMTSIDGVAHTYNGDGVLVASGITRYTQDLVAPLDQVLSDGTSTYVYGAKRLFGDTSGTRTWYTTDLLGSVRQTLSDSGAILTSTTFDPWGVVESGTSAPFGFTGELTAGGLVYLRARWYDPANGIFPAQRWRTNESSNTTPYSHHVYAYALGNPLTYTDPAGTYAISDSGDGYSCASGYVWDSTQYRLTGTGCIPIVTDEDIPTDWREQGLDDSQTFLDGVGLIPVLGEPADVLNAAVYCLRGDYVNAGLSATAIIPFVGWGATAAKFGQRIINAGGAWVTAAARHGNNVADLVERTGKVGDSAREVITLTRSGSRIDAFRVTQDIVGDLGNDAIVFRGKFDTQKGRIVGLQSANKRRGWRIDYDKKKAAHYNYFDLDRDIYGAVPFDGTQGQVDQLIDMLNRTYG